VEYVAVGRDGWVVGGLAGRELGSAPGLVVAVVSGGDGATVAPGCGVWDWGAPGPGAFGPAVAGARPGAGTVEVGLSFGGVLVGAVADDPDSSSLTTSWGARTGAGRSVTSAATMDVAAQTMAVDTMVTASQSPTASRRGNGTLPGWSLRTRPRAKGTLKIRPTLHPRLEKAQ